MTCTIVMPGWLSDEIEEALQNPLETAAVLLGTVRQVSADSTRILVRGIRWVDESAYLVRKQDALSIASNGYVSALQEAETLSAVAIWMHTHPSSIGIPLPSRYDKIVDDQISDLFALRTGSEAYGSIIFSPGPSGATFSGYIEQNKIKMEIDRLWIVGDRFRFTESYKKMNSAKLSSEFDRSVRAFGGAIQSALGKLRIAVVGNGGTGSSVAEQLTRLGVRDLLLVDPDNLSESNLTRVYGSKRTDIGRSKTHILRDHLKEIVPDIKCESISESILSKETAKLLLACDLIFGCTDDNAGRLVLSRLASYFLIPVLDCGVLLSSDKEHFLNGINGRVTTMAPGLPCLVCRDRIDLRRAAAEQLEASEQRRLASEGYAPDLGQVEPAVVTFTTAVAAAAVAELLERFIGYGPTPRPSEVLLRFHDREISTNLAQCRAGHYCDPAGAKIGSGVMDPFLDQAWL